MSRRIVLELAEDTTAASCGSCRWYEDAVCHQWHVVAYNGRRLPECLAAERQAERMLDVSPEDAAIVVVQRTCVGEDPEPHRRVYGALRAHARKAKR